jgi:2-amino-4-hydroxy-6-hydroxymethyldihydropteridine diphosphokinase
MTDMHEAYLSLGSNIEPETNLPAAVRLLEELGRVRGLSRAWESQAVGSSGPNFLNACAFYLTDQGLETLTASAHAIESRLGRVRTDDPNAARQIDIDVMMYDGAPLNVERWAYPFFLVPLAELAPELRFPATGEPLSIAAERARQTIWIIPRPDIMLASQS